MTKTVIISDITRAKVRPLPKTTGKLVLLKMPYRLASLFLTYISVYQNPLELLFGCTNSSVV